MPRANRLDEEEEEAKADICVPLLTLSVRLGASCLPFVASGA